MKVIITGATGMVGKGVLLECLDHAEVEQVLLINRRPIDLKHPKLVEVMLISVGLESCERDPCELA
ncbi:MAG: hypothetical protein RIE55_00300, partial [Marinoscillum sp.]